jgi:uncharacterized membrane protein
MDPKLLIPTPFESAPNLHPMLVHFPVALLPVALLLFALAWWRKNEGLFTATRACVYLGALGALAAAFTGWNAAGSIPHNDTIHRMMETHKYAAFTVLAGTVLAAVWCWWKPISEKTPGIVLGVLLIAINLLLVSVGDLGARMVYQQGAGVIPAVDIIQETSPAAKTSDDHPESEEAHQEQEHEH